MKRTKKTVSMLLLLSFLMMTGCGQKSPEVSVSGVDPSRREAVQKEAPAEDEQMTEPSEPQTDNAAQDDTKESLPAEPVEKNGEVMVLYTSDVHCGIDQGFGYAGLAQIRDTLEAEGYTTILVDDGDAIQGEAIGTISKGEQIIRLMNDLHYDAAIPGNHEFDYGMEQFLHLSQLAEFPYISCNFNKEGQLVFAPYVIKEACGMKIAFVGITTPKTTTSSTPAYFQNEKGEYIYDFMRDNTGEKLYQAVQEAVDAARAEGADYVYVMAHLGMEDDCRPWTYADVISHTNGIDVFLDGHSHDTEQIVMKNRDGEEVVRSAVGTKLSGIGFSHITPGEGIVETDVWSWPNDTSAPQLLHIENEVSAQISEEEELLGKQLNEVVAQTTVELTISDPVEKDDKGNPIRMVRRAETNLGDLCADAYRDQGQADVAIMNGGGIRKSIEEGDITYGDILSVHPFGNELCVVEVTGQQILDALEWGAKALPGESGGFLQVSGMSYEIDTRIPSGCVSDENGLCVGIKGERRVGNVRVGDEPIDPKKTYTLAAINYIVLSHGDGNMAFEGAKLLQDCIKLDNQVLIDYITGTLGGVIGEEYADPYGQGRITIIEDPEAE